MSTFFIEEDPIQKQKRKRKDIVMLVLAVLLLALTGYVSATTGKSYFIFFGIGIYAVLFAPAVYRLFVKSKKWFVDVNDINIVFRTKYQENNDKEMRARIVDWNDIKWIKKENNNSISLYQQSSFAENIALTGFGTEAQEIIIKEVQQQALARGIQVVDF